MDEYGTFINQVFIRWGLSVYENALNIVSIFSIKTEKKQHKTKLKLKEDPYSQCPFVYCSIPESQLDERGKTILCVV